ncbi:hypothetical protein B4168_3015 [Anoxybacillus flavithermus]|nr:hypothetical protein B4168_3015 [Anoxybacillus flavithermus]OAO86304.1 hypothetical protein GT23_2197 [Parageobacillus thermoglucosidasius]
MYFQPKTRGKGKKDAELSLTKRSASFFCLSREAKKQAA